MKVEEPKYKPNRANSRSPRLLIRSSWQTVNIGDIGHTPGLLRLLRDYLPEAEVTLWAVNLDYGVDGMLRREFPNVRIIDDVAAADYAPESTEGRRLWDEADFFLHGSGPYLVAHRQLRAWADSGRPYGVYGLTLENLDDEIVNLLSGANFVFCRDTISLQTARARGVTSTYLEFAPDAAFAAKDRDDELADQFLAANGLADENFICVISRLRYTPYYSIHDRPATERERWRARVSEVNRHGDHERLRRVITRWIRETGRKVLVCPEMTYEMELTKAELVDPLPDDIRRHVVWRSTYWRPDEATSVYARAAAVVSMEMHSPILAFAVDTPAIYLRLPTDTCKGQMWRDIGLPEWVFEIKETDGDEIATMLLQLAAEPDRTVKKLRHAQERVEHLQAFSMGVVRRAANAAFSRRYAL